MIFGIRLDLLRKIARERGYPLDDAMACIVNRDGDTITVDTDHPAYPRDRNPSPAEQAIINRRLDATIGQTMEHGCGCSPPANVR